MLYRIAQHVKWVKLIFLCLIWAALQILTNFVTGNLYQTVVYGRWEKNANYFNSTNSYWELIVVRNTILGASCPV